LPAQPARNVTRAASESHSAGAAAAGGPRPAEPPTCSRARLTAALALEPYVCEDDGLPKSTVKHGSMADNTSGSSGEVAL
jgi:hypothetical protein